MRQAYKASVTLQFAQAIIGIVLYLFSNGLFIYEIRVKRDELLLESDWTQFNDSPLSDAKKEEWKVYRQALRDMTIKYADPPLNEKGYMDNAKIDWPEKP